MKGLAVIVIEGQMNRGILRACANVQRDVGDPTSVIFELGLK